MGKTSWEQRSNNPQIVDSPLVVMATESAMVLSTNAQANFGEYVKLTRCTFLEQYPVSNTELKGQVTHV